MVNIFRWYASLIQTLDDISQLCDYQGIYVYQTIIEFLSSIVSLFNELIDLHWTTSIESIKSLL